MNQMKQANNEISVDLIKSVFQDLFYNRVSPNKKPRIMIWGTEEEIQRTIETLINPIDFESKEGI